MFLTGRSVGRGSRRGRGRRGGGSGKGGVEQVGDDAALTTTITMASPGIEPMGTISEQKNTVRFDKLPGKVEACECTFFKAGGSEHGLMQAVHYAFTKHVPLELSPDDFWLLVAQGVARHESETKFLGNKYDELDADSKVVIRVRRDGFVRGSKQNDWPGVFPEFQDKIKAYLPDSLYGAIMHSGFTTTTPLARVATVVTFMDTLQNYFSYRVMTMCGVPRVRLTGTRADWQHLLQTVNKLSTEIQGCGIDDWLATVKDILGKVTKPIFAPSEPLDTDFWSSIYKYRNGSGGPHISGWMVAFFPYHYNSYDGSYSKAPFSGSFQPEEHSWGFSSDCVPNGLSIAPFLWEYLSSELKYKFVAGFFGPQVTADRKAVKPALGWAILDCEDVVADEGGFEYQTQLERLHEMGFEGQDAKVRKLLVRFKGDLERVLSQLF